MNLTRIMSSSALVVILVFLGCRHSAVAYVLHRNGADAVLSPPLRSTDTAEPISVAINNARRNTKSDCDIAGDVISLQWQGSCHEQGSNQLQVLVNSVNATTSFNKEFAERWLNQFGDTVRNFKIPETEAMGLRQSLLNGIFRQVETQEPMAEADL